MATYTITMNERTTSGKALMANKNVNLFKLYIYEKNYLFSCYSILYLLLFTKIRK